jgi:thiamine-phosphate pyrophosphorylase
LLENLAFNVCLYLFARLENSLVKKFPLIYLITDGEMTVENFNRRKPQMLELIKTAAENNISLIQIREKNLPARFVFELTVDAANLTRSTETKLLVNDRADIALAARANGVHLATQSLSPVTIRQNFPKNFIIGVSTHSILEVLIAKKETADFTVFSPIFATPSKTKYNLPSQGLKVLSTVCQQAKNFPIIALGGVDETNLAQIFSSGADGIAAIRFLNDARKLPQTIDFIRQTWKLLHQNKANENSK